MKTFQDLQKVAGSSQVSDWLISAINEYKGSKIYAEARTGDDYAHQLNTTITNYQKLLYTISGKQVPDNYSANHKCASNFFQRFVRQEVSYLLGNGASFNEESTKERLGKDFDKKLYMAGKNALIHGVTYGFFNADHLVVFTALEFCPFLDEENGTVRAGVRFWQLDDDKPLRFTLYEEDGYTDFVKNGDADAEVMGEKKTYKQKVSVSVADGVEISNFENYPSFPIIPLWGNLEHQSEIVGMQSQIDCYDLIKSGFANDLDDATQIYWIIKNAGGMEDEDIVKFLQRIKRVHAASVDADDGATAESHTVDIPYQSRETYLDRLEKDMYKDFMALDVESIASGAATATQIRASYEPLNEKSDEFAMNVTDFVQEILKLIGIDDEVTFTPSMIVNQQEMITVLTQAATHLSDEYVTKKILEILGDIDKLEEIQKQKLQEDADRFKYEQDAEESEDLTNEPEQGNAETSQEN